MTLHPVSAVENPELEETLEGWVQEQRFAELALSPQDIIDKAMLLLPTFKDGNEKIEAGGMLFHERSNLCMRSKIRVSEVIDPLLLQSKQEYYQSVQLATCNDA